MPSTYTGTYTIDDLRAARLTSAKEFGLDTINSVLQADIAAHNAIVTDLLGEFVTITTDAQRVTGTSYGGSMVEVDEFGRAATQKGAPGTTVAFPLRSFQFPIGWTDKWLMSHSPAEMAEQTLAAEKADLKNIQREIKRALFLSTNYSVRDFLVDNVTLAVKRLYNADSSDIPEGPNGEVFDGSTHSHYNANSSLTETVLDATITDVIEHGNGGEIIIGVNVSDTATISGLTNFVPLTAPNIIAPTDAASTIERLDTSRVDNRLIGYYKGYPVWTKVWVPADYLIVWDRSAMEKPLAMRQRNQETMQGLRVAAELDTFPLHAKYFEREFGIGVWGRSSAAVLDFGNASYTDPTIS